MRKRSLILAAAAILATTGVLLGWRLLVSRQPGPVVSPERLALGRQIYTANCASCHGSQLQGQPNWKEHLPNGLLPAPPHDASGHTWHHPDQQLFRITKLGVGAMVPNYKSSMLGFGDRLSDDEIWSVIAYIKSTWPADIQARQRAATENAAEQGLGPSGAQ